MMNLQERRVCRLGVVERTGPDRTGLQVALRLVANPNPNGDKRFVLVDDLLLYWR